MWVRQRAKEITNARKWGVGIITALLGLGLFVSEAERIRSLDFQLIHYMYLSLLLVTGALIFLWIWASQRELDLLFEWLDPEGYVPPSSIKETVLILFFAVTLIAMLFSARNPVVYGIVFTGYCAVQLPAGAYMNREIRKAVQGSMKRVEGDLADPARAPKAALYRDGIEVLETCFLKRPVGLRCVMILLASMIATATAIWGQASDDPLPES